MNSVLASTPIWRAWAFVFNRGPAAQLGARFHGMEEVVGRLSVAPPSAAAYPLRLRLRRPPLREWLLKHKTCSDGGNAGETTAPRSYST